MSDEAKAKVEEQMRSIEKRYHEVGLKLADQGAPIPFVIYTSGTLAAFVKDNAAMAATGHVDMEGQAFIDLVANMLFLTANQGGDGSTTRTTTIAQHLINGIAAVVGEVIQEHVGNPTPN